MTPTPAAPIGPTGKALVKTTIVISDALRHRLKVQAAKERLDVSKLLQKLAAAYLDKRGG